MENKKEVLPQIKTELEIEPKKCSRFLDDRDLNFLATQRVYFLLIKNRT